MRSTLLDIQTYKTCSIGMAIKTRVTGIATLVLICMLWLTSRNNARTLMSSTSKLQLQSQSSHQNPTPSASTAPIAPPKPTDRPLILYAYSESSSARENLEFFIAHGLHASADFIFIFNGETDAQRLLPNATNIESIGRENKCWDLGAYAEVLKKNDRWKKYKRFIMLNASIRGPFMPHWAGACWSDRYLSKVTEKVKLVGMTMNCWPNPHVQSMIWATDNIGLNLLLHPPPTTPNPGTWLPRMPTVAGWQEAQNDPTFPSNIQIGMDNCPETYYEAIAVEVGATSVIRGAGYEVDAMLARFHSKEEYIEKCDVNKSEDMLYEKGYEGTNIHPFETIFIKTNRDIDPLMIEQYTKWTDGARYSSYEFC